jgi:hypothetical protein
MLPPSKAFLIEIPVLKMVLFSNSPAFLDQLKMSVDNVNVTISS